MWHEDFDKCEYASHLDTGGSCYDSEVFLLGRFPVETPVVFLDPLWPTHRLVSIAQT